MNNFLTTLFIFFSFSLLAQKKEHYLSTSFGIPLVYKFDNLSYGVPLSIDYQFLVNKNGFGVGLQLEYLHRFGLYGKTIEDVIAQCKYVPNLSGFGTGSVFIGYSDKNEYVNLNFPLYYLRSIYSTKKVEILAKIGSNINYNIYNRYTVKYPKLDSICTVIDPNPITSTNSYKDFNYLHVDILASATITYKVTKRVALLGALQYQHGLIARDNDSIDRLFLCLGTRFKL